MADKLMYILKMIHKIAHSVDEILWLKRWNAQLN